MNTIVRGWHVQNEFVLGRRKSSATVSDSYGYTRPRVAAGPPSVSAPPEAVKDAHPPARTSVPMPAVNAAVSAWYVRDEIGLNSRKTSATSSDKFGYTRLHVTAPPLLNSSPSTAGRTVHAAGHASAPVRYTVIVRIDAGYAGRENKTYSPIKSPM